MEIIPLLIFIGGIIYTAIAGQKNKDKNEERNIDPGKMDRPTRSSAPRRRQNETSERPKGLFDDLFGEVERRVSGEEQQRQQGTRQTAQETRNTRPANEKNGRQSSQRPMTERSFGRSLEEKAKETSVGRQAMQTFEEKEQEVRQRTTRAERKREETQSISRFDRTSQSEIETGGRVQRKRPEPEKEKPKIKKESLSFDRKDIVNGIIFSEIIGKPKSRK